MNNLVTNNSNKEPINNKKENYILSSGSNIKPDDINYKQLDYNNYQSWSNIRNGFINVNSIDQNSNIVNNYFRYSRLQPLTPPFDTFADTHMTWAPYNSIHSQPNNDFMKNNKKKSNNNNVNNNNVNNNNVNNNNVNN